MANPIAARSNGDHYQGRHFWRHALDLLDPNSGVIKVGYEWKEAKSFDDVVVFYDPPMGQSHARPLSCHLKQIKWQTTRHSRFGYQDLADPLFIGASSVSLLHRLKNAVAAGNNGDRYSLVTTARITDGDPLAELVSAEDGVIRLDKLKVGKTEASKMGAVRKFWREALDLQNDDELYDILDQFAILDGEPNMEEMREQVTVKAKSMGIHLSSGTTSDFRFDSLAVQLIKSDIQTLDRTGLLEFLKQQDITIAPTLVTQNQPIAIALQSFDRLSTDAKNFSADNVLSLLSKFDGRYLKQDASWSPQLESKIIQFLSDRLIASSSLRLILDAHASIAFLAGKTLHLKSGATVELVQNGRKGKEIWYASDCTSMPNTELLSSVHDIGAGTELAVAISLTRSTGDDALAFAKDQNRAIGKLVEFLPSDGPQQLSVQGGQHASELSDAITTKILQIKSQNQISKCHFFVSAPNSLLFFLGQQAQALGELQMYEFDFDRAKGGSYSPSFRFLDAQRR